MSEYMGLIISIYLPVNLQNLHVLSNTAKF